MIFIAFVKWTTNKLTLNLIVDMMMWFKEIQNNIQLKNQEKVKRTTKQNNIQAKRLREMKNSPRRGTHNQVFDKLVFVDLSWHRFPAICAKIC